MLAGITRGIVTSFFSALAPKAIELRWPNQINGVVLGAIAVGSSFAGNSYSYVTSKTSEEYATYSISSFIMGLGAVVVSYDIEEPGLSKRCFAHGISLLSVSFLGGLYRFFLAERS